MDRLAIDFAPLFPWSVLVPLAAAALLFAGFGLARRARGTVWRAGGLAVLWIGLANPVLVEEERERLPDVAAVVVDDSPSQRVAGRRERTEAALEHLQAGLARLSELEVKVVRAGAASGSGAAGPVDGTRLFDALGQALGKTPRRRMAATILLTDGQVHDAPGPDAAPPVAGPLHVLLTGRRGERDRMLTVEHAPRFALVGKSVALRIRVSDEAARGAVARVRIGQGDGEDRVVRVPIGRPHEIPIDIDRAGSNIVRIEVEPGAGELTAANNRAVLRINGVRERLRVLLVSGKPHPGERVWRNFLKADPSVDLVHFTILRPPEKQDATPVRELSLIAFPIRELFEVRLSEFDLIIFDRYRRRGVIPSLYLDNIVRYVREGGALLEAAGPGFASPSSLFRTPLGAVLPGEPTGRVFERGLRARPASTGLRHPVTADLPGVEDEPPRWGRWFRQIEVAGRRGMVLMNGAEAQPLLILDRVGDGRVAQLLSDHVWLWARGFEGGGPHAELLRRLAHWLMKEPDLEENDLRSEVEGGRLSIVRRSLEADPSPVQVTAPSGEVRTLRLEEGSGGRSRATIAVEQAGVYRISDARRTTLAAVGDLNPLEFADMRATADRLAPAATATGGGVLWAADGLPSLRRVRPGRVAAGEGWLGLVANRVHRVVSLREAPLLPAVALLVLALGALMLAWRREGR